uniref:Transmembrane protein 135 N-terminal domain-containing protein n=2 Tax=Graphocephala atropunctata TaxID=36148 RepID=A0A1B6LE43_9HEMI
MVVFSRPKYRVVEHLPCTFIHPWTSSCTYNSLTMTLQSVWGSSKFFLLIYLFQWLLKYRSFKYEVLEQQVRIYLKSCLFGGFCGGSSLGVMCFLRWLLGRYTVLTLGLIPGMVGGGGIFIEDPSRRGLDLTLFIALVADLYLKVFEEEALFPVSRTTEFVIFSSCSSLLLYCLRKIKGSYSILWPFIPHRLPEDHELRKQCPHKGNCLNDITKSSITFFCYGLILQSLKVTAFNFKLLARPTLFLRHLFQLNNLRLPIFAGLYVTLLKGVSCLLVRCRGRDEAWHVLPAAAVASFCYLIHPNLSLALIAFSNLSQVVCRQYRKKLKLPEWPWEEMLFMLLMGLLFHTRASHPQCFPRYMYKVMDTGTENRTQIIYSLVEKHLLLRF